MAKQIEVEQFVGGHAATAASARKGESMYKARCRLSPRSWYCFGCRRGRPHQLRRHLARLPSAKRAAATSRGTTRSLLSVWPSYSEQALLASQCRPRATAVLVASLEHQLTTNSLQLQQWLENLVMFFNFVPYLLDTASARKVFLKDRQV